MERHSYHQSLQLHRKRLDILIKLIQDTIKTKCYIIYLHLKPSQKTLKKYLEKITFVKRLT